VKLERQARLMAHQEAISRRRLAGRVGHTIEVLVDEVVDGTAVGRSRGDAPEIDGRVYLDVTAPPLPGTFVRAVVTSADAHDLWGTVIEGDVDSARMSRGA
jgi:ribosomal protein S12 methylthiotransferase